MVKKVQSKQSKQTQHAKHLEAIVLEAVEELTMEVEKSAAAEVKAAAEAAAEAAEADIKLKAATELLTMVFAAMTHNKNTSKQSAWEQPDAAADEYLDMRSKLELAEIIEVVTSYKQLAKSIFLKPDKIIQIRLALKKKEEEEAATAAEEAAEAAAWASAFEFIENEANAHTASANVASSKDVRPATVQEPLFDTPHATTRRSGVSNGIQNQAEAPEVYGLTPSKFHDLIKTRDEMLTEQNRHNAENGNTSKGEKEKDKSDQAICATLMFLQAGFKNEGKFECIFTKGRDSYSPYYLCQQEFYTRGMLPKHLASVGLKVDSLEVRHLSNNELEVSGYINYKYKYK